jgi:hypothetical protein
MNLSATCGYTHLTPNSGQKKSVMLPQMEIITPASRLSMACDTWRGNPLDIASFHNVADGEPVLCRMFGFVTPFMHYLSAMNSLS